MAVGLIGYLSKRGLGNMAHDLRKQLNITRQLVVPDGEWPYNLNWCNAEEFYLRQWEVEKEDLAAWKETDDIDKVISIETGFGDSTFRYAKDLGMKTALIIMWEHFHPKSPGYQNVDLYICPSFKAYQECPFDNKKFLPWPIDTDEFIFRQRTGPAKTFVVNAGSGGMNGRKGTAEAIQGFIAAGPSVLGIKLILRSQVDIATLMPPRLLPSIESAVKLGLIHIEGPTVNRADQYTDGDVLLFPSRYEGHSLVGIEAMSCGMPVITTDAEPMNELFKSRDLLVRVARKEQAGTVNPHCVANIVDIDDLASKIQWCATHDMSEISAENRRIAEKEHSWKALGDRWRNTIESL